ncbi:MAG: hypothetical protein O3A00_01940, partial [Planctomycetota bacterium]|nr:hypothetical protein [Planctomycetota bacterium]
AVRNCRVNRTRPLEIAVVCGLAGIGFTVPIIALALSCDLDMLAVWRWNLSNHSNFYSRFSRTYWRWLLVNIPETLIAVGLPLILHAVATCRARSANMINDNPPTAAWRSQFVFAAVWLLLWLSGKNSGEAGRLWILLMPWVVLASGHGGGTASRFGMVIQAIFCLAVASRVSGFQFTG